MSSNFSFCPTKPGEIKFKMILKKEKQQVVIFEEQNQLMFGIFCLINYFKQLINCQDTWQSFFCRQTN